VSALLAAANFNFRPPPAENSMCGAIPLPCRDPLLSSMLTMQKAQHTCAVIPEVKSYKISEWFTLKKTCWDSSLGPEVCKHWRVVWRVVVPPWRMNHACWTCLSSFCCRRYALYRVSVILVTTTNIIREDVATNSDWLWRSSVQQSIMLTTYCV